MIRLAPRLKLVIDTSENHMILYSLGSFQEFLLCSYLLFRIGPSVSMDGSK